MRDSGHPSKHRTAPAWCSSVGKSVLALLFCALFSATAAQTCGIQWEWSLPSPTMFDLRAVTPLDGGYVAVGGRATILKSPDGLTWRRQAVEGPILDTLVGVVNGPHGLVAVGDGGALLHSPDGERWFRPHLDLSVWPFFHGVAYQDSQYVVLGDGGVILTSPDGVVWSENVTGLHQNFVGTAYGGGRHVAISYGGDIVTSVDGATWFPAPSVPSGYALKCIAYGTPSEPGLFVAGAGEGQILTSTDGLVWTARQTGLSQAFFSIGYDGSRFMAAGYDGLVATSFDGLSWQRRQTGIHSALFGLCKGGHGYVAVGSTGTVLNSADGEAWVLSSIPSRAWNLYDVATDGERWVAVGEAGVLASSLNSAATWTPRTSGVHSDLRRVACGGGKFLAVGSDGQIVSSADAVTWNPAFIGRAASLFGIAYLNGAFWAVGQGGLIASSPDGISWTFPSSGTTQDLYGIAFGAGKYVAIGYDGAVTTSTDGANWQVSPVSGPGGIKRVIYRDGHFTAAGGGIATSVDGTTWVSRGFGSPNDIAYGGGLYIAAGYGQTQTSPNAENWALRSDPSDENIEAMAASGDLFVAVGPWGLMKGHALPTIASITPINGDVSGGTEVVVTGSGFANASAVGFGEEDATSFTVHSDTSITATSPPTNTAGRVMITLDTPSGRSLPGDAAVFTYVGQPSVTSVSPSLGPDTGGDPVIIKGHNFTGVSSVRFGAQEAVFSELSDTTISSGSPGNQFGTVDVTVTTPGGTSATVPEDGFTYYPTPSIMSVAPTGGGLVGGTPVVILGEGFTGANTVTFDGVHAPSFTLESDARITALTPPHGAGVVNVGVENAYCGTFSGGWGFTYVDLPELLGLDPAAGPTGGPQVTLSGRNLYTISAVWFGDQPGYIIDRTDTTTFVTAPVHPPGVVDVVVQTMGGVSAVGDSSKFTYFAPVPEIWELRRNSGACAGGDVVHILGKGLALASAVRFGETNATSFQVIQDGEIVATSPPHAAGTIDVTVTTSGGTSAMNDNSKFLYSSVLPTVTGVSPASGSVFGGTNLIITGSGFMHSVDVLFGTRSAADYMVESDTKMVVFFPPHAAGTVDITLVSTFGKSLSSDNSKFTYCDCGVNWEWVNPIPKPSFSYGIAEIGRAHV